MPVLLTVSHEGEAGECPPCLSYVRVAGMCVACSAASLPDRLIIVPHASTGCGALKRHGW